MRWLAVLILVLGAVGGWFYQDYQSFLRTPLSVPGSHIEYEVRSGASVGSIGRELAQQGVLANARYWQIYARLSDKARQIKAGDYAIKVGATPISLLDDLVAGRVIEYSLTILEGWTFRQMLAAVQSHEHIKPTLAGLDEPQIMAKLGYPDQHPEGRFFPDTYRFPKHTTDLAFLRRAYAAMERQLLTAWEQRQADGPLKQPYEALILASIIEKETGADAERPTIAGVFHRRLQKGMRLQTDPTVIYGLGDRFDGNLRRRDLTADTPYNTYTRDGLPPTPIALPGAASLRAAVAPADGKALYFVGKGDGSHQFSNSLHEHNKAVRKYQLKK